MLSRTEEGRSIKYADAWHRASKRRSRYDFLLKGGARLVWRHAGTMTSAIDGSVVMLLVWWDCWEGLLIWSGRWVVADRGCSGDCMLVGRGLVLLVDT